MCGGGLNLPAAKILVVDDEVGICELIGIYLKNEGFEPVFCNHGDDAVNSVKRENPDLIILDVLLPGIDGIEVCQAVRQVSSAPIIFVSCKNEDSDKILGLRVGGDDYLTKPFNPAELVARVKAQLRRTRMAVGNQDRKLVEAEGLTIDREAREVQRDGQLVQLSAKEFEILLLLASNPQRVFTHDQILNMVWDTAPLEHDARTVMVHVSNLRKKIEPDSQNPRYVLTVHSVGYKFNQSILKAR